VKDSFLFPKVISRRLVGMIFFVVLGI